MTKTEYTANKGCPACKIPNVTGTNFKDFKNNYAGPFTLTAKLKYGELLQCTLCGTHWYVNEENIWVDAVSHDKLKLVYDWNSRDLRIKPEQMTMLRAIGCTPKDYYGNLGDYIRIPCKCITMDGHVVEPAVVSIQRKPPVGSGYSGKNTFYYIDEIAKIEPSELALPLDVRIATSQAREVSMNFAPTFVLAPYNILYVLNGTTNFFEECDIKGNQITLSEPGRTDTKNIKYKTGDIATTKVIADWWPGIEESFKKN